MARAAKARKKNKKLLADPIAGIALPFKPHYWWYEVFSLGKRFALTSFILYFSELRNFLVYTILVAVSFHIAEREWSAERDHVVSKLSHWLSWNVVLCLFYMMFLDAG